MFLVTNLKTVIKLDDPELVGEFLQVETCMYFVRDKCSRRRRGEGVGMVIFLRRERETQEKDVFGQLWLCLFANTDSGHSFDGAKTRKSAASFCRLYVCCLSVPCVFTHRRM